MHLFALTRPALLARSLMAGCLLVAQSSYASAAPQGWSAVDAATLGALRGGLVGPGALTLSLGIERLVSINGEVVARTSFHLADMANLSVEQARQTSAALSGVKLIQNGSDNIVQAVFAEGGAVNHALSGTVIQNSLSDQQIASSTVINSSVNSLGLLKTINFNASVSDAIMRGAGPP